jgi:hypothetical protein
MIAPTYCTAQELEHVPGFLEDRAEGLPHIVIEGKGTFYPNVFLARVKWLQDHDDEIDMERRANLQTETVAGFTFFRFNENTQEEGV